MLEIEYSKKALEEERSKIKPKDLWEGDCENCGTKMRIVNSDHLLGTPVDACWKEASIDLEEPRAFVLKDCRGCYSKKPVRLFYTVKWNKK